MEEDRCLFCGKTDHNFVNIHRTNTFKHKIETCLPIIVFQGSVLPQIICTVCQRDINNFYTFINNCIEHITNLEAKASKLTNFESCIKANRKKDATINVEPIDLPIKLLNIPSIETFEPIVIKTDKLVDYDSYSDTEDEVDTKPATNNSLIEEIVERKNLKRKIDTISTPNECKSSKIPKLDTSTASRRKKNPPKKISYHLEDSTVANDVDKDPQSCLLCDKQFSGFVGLTNHIFEVHGLDFTQIYSNTPPTTLPVKVEDPPEVLLPPKKKIPELVKISDLNLGKLGSKLTIELVEPNKEPAQDLIRAEDSLEIIPTNQEILKPTMSSLNDSLFICNECPNNRRSFTNFTDFSTHRRSQHSIFHCDLCPKFYGRNSHLWKHVNRVHKGHSSVTCSECGKTSASEYHLQQHKNKMHSNLNSGQKTEKNTSVAMEMPPIATVAKEEVTNNAKATTVARKTTAASNNATVAKKQTTNNTKKTTIVTDVDKTENSELLSDIELSDDENDILNRKFEGFDFNSVKQSFLRQELLDKRERYVNVLKKNNILGENETIIDTKIKDTLPPKEIDASSDLYTTIITNYSRPTNDGPYKCPKCHKGFHKKSLLKKHKKNCRPKLQKDLLTRCKTCSRIFKDRQSLSKHLTNYHSKYNCELCNITVSSKCEIISHIRFSHPTCDLKCEHCGQILRNKSELNNHKSNLQNSFICTYCGDSLTTKIRLKMHILSLHRKILSLSCGICLKLFESQYILRNHVKLAHFHQLKKFVSCTICGKNYGTRWKTLDHINKSHGRIFKACKVCLEVFETEKELEKHLQVEHATHTGLNVGLVPEKQPKIVDLPVETFDPPPKPIKVPQKLPEIQPEPEVPDYYEESLLKDSDGDEEFDSFETEQKSSKLTLLEKRLLGQNIPDKEKPLPDELAPEPKDLKESKEPKELKDKKTQDDIFQNSSKRTVYINSNSPSRCEICLKVWPAKKHLWQHLIRCHKQTAATVCGICLKTNPSYSALERHLKMTHPNLLHGQGFGSNFICKICGRYHNASSKLRLHMAIHVGYTGAQHPEQEEMEDEEMSQSDLTLQNQTLNDSNEENDDQNDSENSEENSEDAEEAEEVEEVEEPEETSGSDVEDQKYEDKEIKNEFEDDNYYESLIEEVEASSEEENEENSEAESDLNNPEDMEKEMLKNMIGECRSQRLTVKSEPLDSQSDAEPFSPSSDYDLEIKDEYIKSEQNSEDETSRVKTDETSADELSKDEISSSGDETPPDELDSAIRSISFGQPQLETEIIEETDEELELEEQEVEEAEVEVEIEPEVDDYKRIQRVNESELETAVGSIL